jgi:hypothetical protein
MELHPEFNRCFFQNFHYITKKLMLLAELNFCHHKSLQFCKLAAILHIHEEK